MRQRRYARLSPRSIAETLTQVLRTGRDDDGAHFQIVARYRGQQHHRWMRVGHVDQLAGCIRKFQSGDISFCPVIVDGHNVGDLIVGPQAWEFTDDNALDSRAVWQWRGKRGGTITFTYAREPRLPADSDLKVFVPIPYKLLRAPR